MNSQTPTSGTLTFVLIIDTNSGEDGWHSFIPGLNLPLVEGLLRRPLSGWDDLDACLSLVELLHREIDDLIDPNSNETKLGALEQRLLIRGIHRLGKRCSTDTSAIDFMDYQHFRDSSIELRHSTDDASLRRYVRDKFIPLVSAIHASQEERWDGLLVTAVSPRGETGFREVDERISRMREKFRNAKDRISYEAIGNECIHIIEDLSNACYDLVRHSDKEHPAADRQKTKERLSAIIDIELKGSEHSDLRRFARVCVDLANSVKHKKTTTRQEAGLTADSVILLANMIRRICAPSTSK